MDWLAISNDTRKSRDKRAPPELKTHARRDDPGKHGADCLHAPGVHMIVGRYVAHLARPAFTCNRPEVGTASSPTDPVERFSDERTGVGDAENFVATARPESGQEIQHRAQAAG